VQDLGDQQVGDLVVDLLAQEHDAFAEQAAEDVEGPVAPGALLDDGGDHAHGRHSCLGSRIIGEITSVRSHW